MVVLANSRNAKFGRCARRPNQAHTKARTIKLQGGHFSEYGYHNHSVWLSCATLWRFAYLLGVELGVAPASNFEN